MTQVLTQALDQERNQLHLTNDRVATPAQQPAHASRVVAMIHDKIPVTGVTQKAPPVLRPSHCLHVVGGQSVLPHEARAQVFLSRSFRVGPAPFTQAAVSEFPIGLPVLAVATTRTGAALAPLQSPLGERGWGQVLNAEAARRHSTIMPRGTSTQGLDAPCHADVLLAIASTNDDSWAER